MGGSRGPGILREHATKRIVGRLPPLTDGYAKRFLNEMSLADESGRPLAPVLNQMWHLTWYFLAKEIP